MKSHKTSKGTEIPIMNIKGKPYVQVANRIVWLADDVESYGIATEIIFQDENRSVVKAAIVTYKDGKTYRSAEATKTETKKGFEDHLEKAETGAIGRALALIGFGTQFTGDDFQEGDRLADAPLTVKHQSAVAAPKKDKYKEDLPPPNEDAPWPDSAADYAAPSNPYADIGPVNNAPKTDGKISDAQARRLWTIATKRSWVDTTINQHVKATYGVSDFRQLHWKNYKEAVDYFEKHEGEPPF